MSKCYEASDWRQYSMDYHRPHTELEPVEKEIAVVASALKVLRECDILPSTEYDYEKMLAHRRSVRDAFEIPWTAISPRMQRLLYAISPHTSVISFDERRIDARNAHQYWLMCE